MHHLTPRARRYVAKITRALSARHHISSCSHSRWVIGAGPGRRARSPAAMRGRHTGADYDLSRSDLEVLHVGESGSALMAGKRGPTSRSHPR
jgi:hypothetical protein